MPLICSAVRVPLLAVFGHVHHAPLPQIIHQCQIAVPLPKRLLIHTDLADWLGFSSLQATLHCPLQDAVYLVPTQLQQAGHCFLTGRFEPLDRQQFKQRCESARRLGPRHLHHSHSVVAACATRRLGVQNGPVLASIQVAPLPLRLVVIQLACLSTFRTRPIDHVLVPQANVDLAGFQFQFPPIHVPGSLDSENAPIQFMVLHPRNCRMLPSELVADPL